MNDKPFWMVWSEGTLETGEGACVWHFDLNKAEAEAERLSQKHIGTKFYIAYIHSYYLSEAVTKLHDF